MDFLDIHTHKVATQPGVISIQSLSLTSDIFLAMPKTKPISVGLHPWFAKIDQLELQMKYLSVVANQTNVKQIGECGLDRLRGENLENQIIILKNQIELAEKINKPLILHCVKCFAELIAIKDQLKVKVPMVIHGFNKNEELGEQLLDKGFLLSFGLIALKENSGAAKLIQSTNNFFLETDDADISIEEIYRAAAILKKCTVDELKARIFTDWNKLNLKN
ncbi:MULTISPECIES: TatD family hydrolase [unclassified Pedobacter]|uniref:TatD family hydrolase n=1 Tax=unclassified Pedobacter TaxID=2628915 RepID=UPI00119B4A80|nr:MULTISPECIES: TatD family hydrolase [unclassified Pedobacter]NII85963.1 TatD DNase family protein [Pedobacter sp. SG908]NMN39123.1 TatD DNase family protein [Pedobacter sp. SG918]